jgi:hypothetical protein
MKCLQGLQSVYIGCYYASLFTLGGGVVTKKCCCNIKNIQTGPFEQKLIKFFATLEFV